jgi:hypothetical protein
MGGDQKAAFIGLQEQGEEGAGINTQDGPPVGADISHPFQPGLKGSGGLKVREDDEVVDLPGGGAFLVDRADFPGQHKPG